MCSLKLNFLESFPISSSVLKRASCWLLSPQISFDSLWLHMNGIILVCSWGVHLISLMIRSVRFSVLFLVAVVHFSFILRSPSSVWIYTIICLFCSWWNVLFPTVSSWLSLSWNILRNLFNFLNSSLILIKLFTTFSYFVITLDPLFSDLISLTHPPFFFF